MYKRQGVRSYLLGNGSNILFEDAGYRGAVINVSAMKSGIGVIENISFPGKDPALTYDAVVVGAGQMLSSLCMAALENSLTGLEFAYGIPGTVGGAVYMNAGAYGGEMKDVLASVRYLTGEGRSSKPRRSSSTSATATASLKKTAAASSRQSSISPEAVPLTSGPRWTT